MDELSGRRALAILLTIGLGLSACTFRERVAYEDCLRAECGGEGIDCQLVLIQVEPDPIGVNVCTRSCESDEDCPPDPGTALPGRCVALESGQRCFPSCESEYDCAIPLACDPEEGVCLPELP